MNGKNQLMGSLGAIRREPTKADLRRMLEDERAGRIKYFNRRVEALTAALKLYGCHTPDCVSYKTIGRFGSRSGLRWTERTDAKTCTCGLGAAIAGKAGP